MEVRVRVPTQLRELVAGAAVVEICVGEGPDGCTTVAEVRDREGLATAICAGDVLSIIPAVSGG